MPLTGSRIVDSRASITLITTLLLLLCSTSILIYATRQAIVDQWLTANQSAYQSALSQATAGAHQAMAALKQGVISNQDCSSTPLNQPFCISLISKTLHNRQLVQISSHGYAERNASANISSWLGFANLLASPAPAAALISPGNLADIELHLAANPHGGGQDLPVAIWTSGSVSLAKSSSSLFKQSGQLISLPLIPDNEIVSHALAQHQGGSFPDDVFAYLFGYPASQYRLIQEIARPLTPAQCNNLNSNSAGLFWIQGDGVCQLGNVGVADNPDTPEWDGKAVILVSADVTLQIQAQAKVYGLIMVFHPPDSASSTTPVQFTADSQLWGVLLSNYDLNQLLTGTISIIWQDYTPFFGQPKSSDNGAPVLLNGSWMDNG